MNPRRGTILIVVMLIIAALAGMVLALGRSARVEAMSSANHIAGAKAAAVERAAEQYVLALLAQQRQTVLTLDESNFAAVPVGDAGAFWLIRPDYGDSSLPVYGLVDEASKWNLNSNAGSSNDRIPMLLKFRGLPPELPYAINDWRDSDGEISGDGQGAEDAHYLALPTPYRCKNGSFETVEELLLVRGVYPELLYGDGLSGTAAALGGRAMQIGGLSENELLARGFYHYFTVYSRQPPQGEGRGNRDRRGLINVNTAPREILRCLPGLTESDVDSLISRRGTDGFGSTDTQWIGQVLGARAAPVAQFITGESYQFSADIVAASADGRAFRRVRIVVDASNASSRPRVMYRNDLTERGWPLDREILESMRAGTWSAQQRRG